MVLSNPDALQMRPLTYFGSLNVRCPEPNNRCYNLHRVFTGNQVKAIIMPLKAYRQLTFEHMTPCYLGSIFSLVSEVQTIFLATITKCKKVTISHLDIYRKTALIILICLLQTKVNKLDGTSNCDWPPGR